MAVRCMTLEEKGAYHELLDCQWAGRGYLVGDLAMLSRCVGFDVSRFPSVLAMFPVLPDGRRANAVLLDVWGDQLEHHRRRSLSSMKRWGKEKNENENENDTARAYAKRYPMDDAMDDAKHKPETPAEPIMESCRQTMNRMFSRPAHQRLSSLEEHAVFEAVKAGSMTQEALQEVEAWVVDARKDGEAKGFLPQSARKCLDDWPATLDRARTWKDRKPYRGKPPKPDPKQARDNAVMDIVDRLARLPPESVDPDAWRAYLSSCRDKYRDVAKSKTGQSVIDEAMDIARNRANGYGIPGASEDRATA